MSQFVHLHVHSEYSLLEASSGVKSLAKKAKEFGMPALALTDNGNMFCAIEFYFACKDVDVKPILGLEVYHPTHNEIQTQKYLDMANQYQLIITGGSDFHAVPTRFPEKLGLFTIPASLAQKLITTQK